MGNPIKTVKEYYLKYSLQHKLSTYTEIRGVSSNRNELEKLIIDKYCFNINKNKWFKINNIDYDEWYEIINSIDN